MLRVLVKRQLCEVFRSCLYNAKKNQMRPGWAVAAWFAFLGIVVVGVLGGVFTALSIATCRPLLKADMGWLYFLMIGVIAVALGAFGSAFNTCAGLYLGKDNDLLLSMPIPVRTIVAARLVNVYLMGALYSATAMLPGLVVYWCAAGLSAARAVCGLLLFVIVTFIVLVLSCALGWVIAQVSRRLRHKSLVTVIVSLLFIGGYCLIYFKARDILNDLLLNAMTCGARIHDSISGLYRFGRIGEGDWTAAALFLAGSAASLALVWLLLTRSFQGVATAGERMGRARYRERPARRHSAFGALLGKELGRFTASANYMLNCGMGVILLPVAGVLALLKGRDLIALLDAGLPGKLLDGVPVLVCTLLCLIAGMNDMAAPSISLEGKSLWICQSLPVKPGTVLRAKACAQLILTGIPLLFAGLCAAPLVRGPAGTRLLVVALPLAYAAFSAMLNTAVGVRMPVLNWTSELAPIKQSGGVAIALFGGMIVCIAFGGLYLLLGYKMGAAAYMLAWTALLALAALGLLRWLDTRGARAFAAL